ncbi:MAG: hypothetical protein M3Z33_06295 [Actinomycetota bacterium]|nr:hypothetical protein [Actinomycetota bacterium]
MPSRKDPRCRPLIAALGAMAAVGACSAPVAQAQGDSPRLERQVRAHGRSVAVESHVDTDRELGPAANLLRVQRARQALGVPGSASAGALTTPAASAGWLADSWCGTELSGDDTANAVNSSAAVMKVIYARPNGSADRFQQFANVIQGQVKALSTLVYTASGDRKSIRFDLGTSCGGAYVDIQSIQLPRPVSYYQALTANGSPSRFDAILDDVQATVPGTAQKRNYLIYADYLGGGSFPAAGQAELYGDDRAGASNFANTGGLRAVVYGTGEPYFSDSDPSFAGLVPLHETSHTLGAVQDSALHSTQAGHCFDEWDIMCYADGGTYGPGGTLTYASDCGSSTSQAYDCHQDDYFNPVPVGGSYLATHWNLYNSVFLCSSGACGGEPGSGTGGGGTGAGSGNGTTTTVFGQPAPSAANPAEPARNPPPSSSPPLTASALARAVGLVGAGARLAVNTRLHRPLILLGRARCPAVCAGSISLYARAGHTVRLGRASFGLRAGQTAALGVRLSDAGQRLLRRRGRLLATVTLGARNAGASTTWVTRAFTLRSR